TVEEKINALSTQFGVPRLGIRNCGHAEGLHGLAYGGPSNWGSRNPAPSTIFPQAYGLGETWDVELIRRVAAQEGYENRYYFQSPKYFRGALVMRAPNADLARDPRWGRTEESFGEDAFHVARMTVAFVKGLQGERDDYWQTASLMKHFLANSNEDGRDSTSSNISERLFREYYGYTFYKGITEGGSQAYMASYNAVNGTPMTSNYDLLTNVSVKEWGNNGIICTDGGALGMLIANHKAYATMTEGAAAAIKAGITQFLDVNKPYVKEALRLGLLTEGDINQAVRQNFFVALKLGFLDASDPYASIGVKDTIDPWTLKATKDFAREVTAKSVVLLKNNRGILPLQAAKLRKIAVIGPYANEVILDWYSGTPPYAVTILQGIRNAAGTGAQVIYSPTNRTDSAFIAAKEADVAIVVIGNHPNGGNNMGWADVRTLSDGREARDRAALTSEQEELAKIVFSANPNTILVVNSSFPFAINWSEQHLPAILHVTHSSQELGNGLADVLFGHYNPAGRTVQTWPASIEHLPPMMDYDLSHGRTYMYAKEKPLYPFGYGLSYTTFAYSNLKFDKSVLDVKGEVTVSVDVQNTGAMAGDEVVQLYAQFPNSKVARPLKQLKGFARVHIPQGNKTTVTIPLKAEDLAYWDENRHGFVTEPGVVRLLIGASSSDIRLEKNLQVK
ncbi:MAG: glycoside hydrolase family 3 C-terminal domain-containing protein, partial [Tannerellaceae bacterium]|nr:glycoside hydrolase family 3 C-terminal domain-containing protein [Tannerellaceae bacterium]